MSKYKININPFNHLTVIGKIDKPLCIFKNKNYYEFKISIKAPRNYVNHDQKTGKPVRVSDEVRASCCITAKQAGLYKNEFIPGKWVILRGEMRSVTYYSKHGEKITAHPFNLEDICSYKVPHTDKNMMMPFDKNTLISGIKGLNWMLSHPGFVRKFAAPSYKWLMAHDAFVPTKVSGLAKSNKKTDKRRSLNVKQNSKP